MYSSVAQAGDLILLQDTRFKMKMKHMGNVSASLLLVLTLWAGSYLGLRHFCEGIRFSGVWSHRTIEVPDITLRYAVIYEPLQFLDKQLTGQTVVFHSDRFHIGATATF